MILAVTRSHQEPGNQGVIAHATDDSFAVVIYGGTPISSTRKSTSRRTGRFLYRGP